MNQLIAAFVTGAVLSLMVSTPVISRYLSNNIKRDNALACQIGYRLAALNYKKPITREDVPVVIKNAEYKCADWVIEGFIERHTK